MAWQVTISPPKLGGARGGLIQRKSEAAQTTPDPSCSGGEKIADSEPLMKRLTRYAKKLVKEREADPTLMTKEEFFQMIDEAKKGPSKRFDSVEELDKYIRSLWAAIL